MRYMQPNSRENAHATENRLLSGAWESAWESGASYSSPVAVGLFQYYLTNRI
ncbi:hypothetical protein M408DRAFT_328835 [Serendipita vermifera MAFF 305830]|uniref:Uncharacterized protein n=1 Tax=Serendipita vermifera MAFF 305830 TaxID=933852 RepID=A0A0C2WU10_SERVB|nr:hypothetical protein M408DRAFT_328835 [Serendipita vermifera MAFF 305830]